MRLTVPLSAGVAVVLIAFACGGGQEPPPPPPPTINQDSIDAANRRRQDSIDAANRARQDSIRRAQEAAERARRDSLAAVRRETERVRAALETMINFDFDRSEIRTADAQILDQKLAILRANPGLRIAITGNCDERGSDEYNLALGNRRAVAAKQYLVSRGIADSRVTTASNGEERPVDPRSNEEAWARNRNDQFSITAGGDQLRMPGM
jgi:peptidoglycan-associated lipoprotein